MAAFESQSLFRPWHRRAVVGLMVAGSLLVAGAGYAFLQTSGTVSTNITGTTSTVGDVYTGSPLPTNDGTGAFNIAPTSFYASGTTTAQTPSWTPNLNTTGQVTKAGDVAIIDTTGGSVLATLALTNTAALSNGYSYLNLPVSVYVWTSPTSSTGTGSWGLDSSFGTQYLSLTGGYLTFNLPNGGYYELVVDTGGSFYCIDASTPADLSPEFNVTTTPVG